MNLRIIGGVIMISTLTIIFMILSAIICFFMPILLFIKLKRKERFLTGALVGGAVSFYISQMVIRIPLIQLVLPKFKWYLSLSSNLLLFALFLGLTAGLFEELGRYFICKFLLRDRLSWKVGIAHGIGHGGIEAILLVGINYVIYAIFGILYNNNIQHFISLIIPKEHEGLLFNILSDTPSYLFLTAGIERALTIIIHIGISLMIVEGIVRGKELIYFLMAVLFHTLLDAGSVILAGYNVPLVFIELYVVLFSIASIYYIFSSKKRFGNKISPDLDKGMKAVEEGY